MLSVAIHHRVHFIRKIQFRTRICCHRRHNYRLHGGNYVLVRWVREHPSCPQNIQQKHSSAWHSTSRSANVCGVLSLNPAFCFKKLKLHVLARKYPPHVLIKFISVRPVPDGIYSHRKANTHSTPSPQCCL